ncbi:alpha/beta fold hydrolase [Deinococcus altitudinis]|uniref:alpha/beta fold hydrolase n=1 Tax=Deinococcus altitudinis TaxID=468914 RepID=UPI003892C55D
MKKRTVVAALVVVGALALAVAQAQGTQAQTVPTQSMSSAGVQRPLSQTMQPSVSPLAAAFSADRYTFNLIGFGRVGYYSDTRGTGRPLVMVTSVNAAASAYELRPLFEAYRGKRPVYVLEWPGFGSSDRPNIRYTPELMASALSKMLDIVGQNSDAQNPDVLALSLGSEFAARVAIQDPRIHSLVFISPTGLSEAKTPAEIADEPKKAERLYGILSFPPVSATFFGLLTTPQVIDIFLRRSFEGPVDPGLLSYSVQTAKQPGGVYAPLFFVAGLLRSADTYTELYTKLSTPTLILYDRDGYVNFTRLPELLQAKPNVTAVKVTPTKGVPQFEQLGQVTAALDAFWAGLK